MFSVLFVSYDGYCLNSILIRFINRRNVSLGNYWLALYHFDFIRPI